MSPPTPLSDATPRAIPLRGAFARYMGCEAVSMTGTWMQAMAQGWVMATLTHSAFMLGLVNLAGGLPMVLLTMKAGETADRLDKRWILLACQVAQALLAVVMGLLVLSGQIRIEHVVLLSALQGLSNAFEMPTVSALLPELVEKDQIGTAIAVDRAVFHATRLVGPSLAGVAIGFWGTAAAFFANALSFLPLCIALVTLPPRVVGTPEEEAQREDGMRAGLAYVRGDATTLAMIGLIALTTFFVFPAIAVIMPLYARDLLGLPAQGLGLLMSISAIGSVTGAAILLRIPRVRRLGSISLGAGGAATALGCLATAHGLWQAGAGLVLMAVSLSLVVGLATTIVQERAPAYLQGRVSAIAGLAFFGLMPVAGLLLTSLSDLVGMRYALAASGLVFVLGATLMLAGPGRRALAEPSPADAPFPVGEGGI